MGRLYNKNRPIVDIHEAYGIKLRGEIDEYESCLEQCTREIIVRLWINDAEIDLGASWIYRNKEEGIINMEDDKDLLCYYFANNPREPWEMLKFFEKEYHNTIWRERARQMMFKERIDEEQRKKEEERKAKRQLWIQSCEEYAAKKKLRLIVDYDKAYFVKIDKKRHKNSDDVDDKTVLDFADKYPGNGVDIVEVVEELCW